MNITIQGKVVKRGKKQMPVDKFCQVIAQNTISGMRKQPIPDNVRWIVECGQGSVYVLELQPEIRQLVWNDGSAQHSDDERYGRVYEESGSKHTVATPYVVIVIPFFINKISGNCERPVRVFYRNSPLQSIDDQVLSSNLNNVLPVNYGTSSCGSLCLDRLDVNSKMSREEVACAVVNYLWGSEFNTEYGNNFASVAPIDKRIGSIEAWERESKKNPGFVLEVQWPETGISIRNLINQNIKGSANLGNLLLKIAS